MCQWHNPRLARHLGPLACALTVSLGDSDDDGERRCHGATSTASVLHCRVSSRRGIVKGPLMSTKAKGSASYGPGCQWPNVVHCWRPRWLCVAESVGMIDPSESYSSAAPLGHWQGPPCGDDTSNGNSKLNGDSASGCKNSRVSSAQLCGCNKQREGGSASVIASRVTKTRPSYCTYISASKRQRVNWPVDRLKTRAGYSQLRLLSPAPPWRRTVAQSAPMNEKNSFMSSS